MAPVLTPERTDAGLDLDVFLRELADEPDVPCVGGEDGQPVCPRPARWILRCPGCGAQDPMCDEHRLELDIWVHAHTVHHACGAVAPVPLLWRPL